MEQAIREQLYESIVNANDTSEDLLDTIMDVLYNYDNEPGKSLTREMVIDLKLNYEQTRIFYDALYTAYKTIESNALEDLNERLLYNHTNDFSIFSEIIEDVQEGLQHWLEIIEIAGENCRVVRENSKLALGWIHNLLKTHDKQYLFLIESAIKEKMDNVNKEDLDEDEEDIIPEGIKQYDMLRELLMMIEDGKNL